MAAKITSPVVVTRTIGEVKNGKQNTPTKDGKEHVASAIIPELSLASNDSKGFAAAIDNLLAAGKATIAMEPLTLVAKSGATKDVKPQLEYVDGKSAIVAGDKGYIPADYNELANIINAGMQAKAAGKLTAFLAGFKAGAGEGRSDKGLDDFDNVA